MDFITKDLLINFLLIILPLFVVQMIYQVKYAYRFERLKEWTFAVFPIFAVVSSMLFPVVIGDGFSWDLRRIPFILGVLYGGHRLRLLLLTIVVVVRFMIGGDGFYLILITYPLFTILAVLVSTSYAKMSVKNKIITSGLLTIISVMITIFFTEQVFKNNLGPHIWTFYIVFNVICMVVTNLFWEVIRTNFIVLQKVIKAEKLEVISHLAASISHEVRNPLTVSRGFMQMVSNGELSAQERKKYVNIAILELDRATQIISDYLTFAKPVLEKKEEIFVYEEVDYAVKIITPLANMNDIQVNLSASNNENVVVLGERKKFQQCLVNLMKNAIEAMPSSANLNVILTSDQSSIQLEIRDQGTGMTQEQINRLGEPFFTTKEKGTGLGLMVSFSIIKGMNGKINVTSEQGKGTCFTICLPKSINRSNDG